MYLDSVATVLIPVFTGSLTVSETVVKLSQITP